MPEDSPPIAIALDPEPLVELGISVPPRLGLTVAKTLAEPGASR
jgi:hypothetical protein